MNYSEFKKAVLPVVSVLQRNYGFQFYKLLTPDYYQYILVPH